MLSERMQALSYNASLVADCFVNASAATSQVDRRRVFDISTIVCGGASFQILSVNRRILRFTIAAAL